MIGLGIALCVIGVLLFISVIGAVFGIFVFAVGIALMVAGARGARPPTPPRQPVAEADRNGDDADERGPP